MGGQAGGEVVVTITGEYLEDVEQLLFSDARISAAVHHDTAGKMVKNQYVVRIPPGTPPGIYEARAMTRLGVSTSRAFSIGTMPELVRELPNTTLETAFPLPLDTICNAVVTIRSMDHYRVELKQGQSIRVDCNAGRIDSKLKPVLIVADEQGRDLVVQRRGHPVVFTAPNDGSFIVKVHDLTFQGGPYYFYRLAVRTVGEGESLPEFARTHAVCSFSRPPDGTTVVASGLPQSSNGARAVLLPCDIAGSFYPAANVDTFEFNAAKGDEWWVEVVSERLGLPTDPSVLVQHVSNTNGSEVLTDVAEFADIASPIRPSSNAYAYDGPPYNAGSSDVLGKLEIKEDGLHRLQIRDLFGGTRNEPENVYRLIIRKAVPDFALVAWALHMELRNGDRNALSKPIALRGGATIALEVAVVRRDGFSGPIELAMEHLPQGVTATGLTIPSGENRGIMLLTAANDAPRGLSSAHFVGRAVIDGQTVERPCRLASMAWPVPDAWQEIPSPRLLADVPVSVSGLEMAPVTIEPAEAKVWEVIEGQSLKIPLKLTRRSEFSGNNMELKAFGAGVDRAPAFSIPLDKDEAEVNLDFGKLKNSPGDYVVAFYGSAVAKYGHNPGAVLIAEAALGALRQSEPVAAAEVKRLADLAASTAPETKAAAEAAAKEAAEKHVALLAEIAEAEKRVQAATAEAQPKDIVDIVVSAPISIRVIAKETE